MSAATHRRARAFIALLGAGVVLAVPSPTAVAGGSGCPDGAYCLWTKADFLGKRLVVRGNNLTKLPRSMNNKASSVKNRNGEPVFLYKRGDGSGPSVCIAPDGDLNLDQPSGNFDDTVSSARVKDDPCV